jgi:hypothetical protein
VTPETFSLAVPPLLAVLAPARSVPIAGAGGGFDVYAGPPLALALWQSGAQVHLANLSFSELELVDRDCSATEHVAAVTPDTTSPDWYFPERTLARWLAAKEPPSTVHDPSFVDPWLRYIYTNIYNRGVLDDKTRVLVIIGECCVVKAMRAYSKLMGELGLLELAPSPFRQDLRD